MLKSKRLRKQGPRPQMLDAWEVLDLMNENEATKIEMARLRELTRNHQEVTLMISYPKGVIQPMTWNWQFLVAKAFPDAEVTIKCWTKPHADWS